MGFYLLWLEWLDFPVKLIFWSDLSYSGDLHKFRQGFVRFICFCDCLLITFIFRFLYSVLYARWLFTLFQFFSFHFFLFFLFPFLLYSVWFTWPVYVYLPFCLFYSPTPLHFILHRLMTWPAFCYIFFYLLFFIFLLFSLAS